MPISANSPGSEALGRVRGTRTDTGSGRAGGAGDADTGMALPAGSRSGAGTIKTENSDLIRLFGEKISKSGGLKAKNGGFIDISCAVGPRRSAGMDGATGGGKRGAAIRQGKTAGKLRRILYIGCLPGNPPAFHLRPPIAGAWVWASHRTGRYKGLLIKGQKNSGRMTRPQVPRGFRAIFRADPPPRAAAQEDQPSTAAPPEIRQRPPRRPSTWIYPYIPAKFGIALEAPPPPPGSPGIFGGPTYQPGGLVG